MTDLVTGNQIDIAAFDSGVSTQKKKKNWFDRTFTVERPESIELEDYKGFEDLYGQFDDPKNRGLGFRKTVEQKVDNYNGRSGTIKISHKDKNDYSIKFWPDMGKEWVNEQNLKIYRAGTLANLPTHIAPVAAAGSALKGNYFYMPPKTKRGMQNVTPNQGQVSGTTTKGNLQSKEGALQTRISQFQAGGSKSTRDLGLTTDYAKGSTLKKAITERDRARQAGVGEFSKYVDPSDTYFTPQGPYELKSKSTEQMIPSIQRDLFKVIANPKSTESDIRTALNTKAANSIDPEHLTFSIDDIVNQGFGKQLGLRQGALATQQGAASRALAIRDREAKKPIEERTKGGKRDSLKGPQKNLKTNVRSLKDIGSLNLLTKSKDIFKMNRKGIKNELVQFKIGDKEWHHTIFGNKEGGALFLNKVAQDPVVAINLMAKLKSLDLPTSGTVDNLALIEKLEGSHGIGHNKLHNIYRDLGLEQGGPLDFADLMDAVAESYLAGDESAINHFFTLLDVYKERTAPYLKEQTIKSGGVMFKDTGVEKLPEVQQYKPKTEKWRDLVSQTQLDVALNGFAA